jgi:hypothetical protein
MKILLIVLSLLSAEYVIPAAVNTPEQAEQESVGWAVNPHHKASNHAQIYQNPAASQVQQVTERPTSERYSLEKESVRDVAIPVSTARSEDLGSELSATESQVPLVEQVIEDEGSGRSYHSRPRASSVQSAPEGVVHRDNELNDYKLPVRRSSTSNPVVRHAERFSVATKSASGGTTNSSNASGGKSGDENLQPRVMETQNSDYQYTAEDFEDVAFYNTPLWKKMVAQFKAAKEYETETVKQEKSVVSSEQTNVELEEAPELKEITTSPIIDQQPAVVVPPSNSFCYEHRYALAGVGTAVIVTGVMYKLYTDGYFQLLQQYLKKNKRIK